MASDDDECANILVIEENVALLLILCTWLNQGGTNVTCAANRVSGKKLLQTHSYSAVIVQISDDPQCLKFLDEIREAQPRTVLLALCDAESEFTPALCLALGRTNCRVLTVPASADCLGRSVQNALGRAA